MTKAIRLENDELDRAIAEGADLLISGQRRFLLVEVHDEPSEEPFVLTDPEEIAALKRALADDRPHLSTQAAKEFLRLRRKDHGIG